MFHAMGWGTPQAATMAGSKLLLPGRYAATDLGPLVEIMVSEKVTVGDGAPAIFMPMLEYIRKMDVKPDFRGARFLSGATEPPVSLMKGLYDLTGAEIIHAYGATETTPLVTINRLKPWLEETYSEEQRWDLKRKQGYAVVGLDGKIADPSGKELPWGGEWISSVDMENELVSHPAVVDAAVTGVSHPKWEERPIALVLRAEHKGKVQGHLHGKQVGFLQCVFRESVRAASYSGEAALFISNQTTFSEDDTLCRFGCPPANLTQDTTGTNHRHKPNIVATFS